MKKKTRKYKAVYRYVIFDEWQMYTLYAVLVLVAVFNFLGALRIYLGQ